MFSIFSTKKDRLPREAQRTWLRIVALGVGLALVAFLLWSSVGMEDDVGEVVARRGEVLDGRFIEVPCSEDYDGHRRFEGTCHRLLNKERLVRGWRDGSAFKNTCCISIGPEFSS